MNVVVPVIILVLETIVGLCNYVFILCAIFHDFYRQKNLSSSNKILLWLGILDIGYEVLISLGLLDDFIGFRASTTVDWSFLYIMLVLYNICSCAWLTASLGVFYFVKISQIRCLSWFKFHLSSIVPWILLVLQVVSIIHSILSCVLLVSPQRSPGNITETRPSVMKVLAENSSDFNNAALSVTSAPFIILLISTTATIWTLRQHSHRMGRSMESGVDRGHLTPYELVVARMTHFLFFYVIFYTVMLIFFFAIIVQLRLGFWVALVLLSFFPPVQSVLLILGNPRLKDAWKEMARFLLGTNLLAE
ncbi:hypothetical protein GDO81_025946 [Engystomops pustulosus]|uniref:Taste receptor type 2 n=1 Tax=Engystomops pustulosus TaxID=76066 RepID=A0AAV6ZPV4_ENGPU|nr:hypothetical protein GDO81_025946 [Engystomops pustulosus]